MPETLQQTTAPNAADLVRIRKATIAADLQTEVLVPIGDLVSSIGVTAAGLPTAGFAQTFSRVGVPTVSQTAAASATQQFAAIYLRAGQTVTTISFLSGATALGTGVNQWFSIYSTLAAGPVLLGVTNDDTSTAWAANTVKTLTLATAYKVPTSGLYYLGCMVKATTVPTLIACVDTNAAKNGIAPILAGTDATNNALTNPASAPNPAAALTAGVALAWAYVS